jgi:hypothetical protein
LGLGLDAPAWARAGLVDLVVATPRWQTLEFDIPLRKWRKLLGDRVMLAGGLEVNYRPTADAPARHVTPEEARGAAVAVLCSGADAVYLFNYFQNGHPQWSISEYQRVLRTFTSLAALQDRPRRHAVTCRDVTVPGRPSVEPLPVSGRQLSFSLPLGPAPKADWQVEVAIELSGSLADVALPAVSVNGTAGKLCACETLKGGNRLVTYAIPPTALPGKGQDTILVTAMGKETLTVRRVEIALRPGRPRALADPAPVGELWLSAATISITPDKPRYCPPGAG